MPVSTKHIRNGTQRSESRSPSIAFSASATRHSWTKGLGKCFDVVVDGADIGICAFDSTDHLGEKNGFRTGLFRHARGELLIVPRRVNQGLHPFILHFPHQAHEMLWRGRNAGPIFDPPSLE